MTRADRRARNVHVHLHGPGEGFEQHVGARTPSRSTRTRQLRNGSVCLELTPSSVVRSRVRRAVQGRFAWHAKRSFHRPRSSCRRLPRHGWCVPMRWTAAIPCNGSTNETNSSPATTAECPARGCRCRRSSVSVRKETPPLPASPERHRAVFVADRTVFTVRGHLQRWPSIRSMTSCQCWMMTSWYRPSRECACAGSAACMPRCTRGKFDMSWSNT